MRLTSIVFGWLLKKCYNVLMANYKIKSVQRRFFQIGRWVLLGFVLAGAVTGIVLVLISRLSSGGVDSLVNFRVAAVAAVGALSLGLVLLKVESALLIGAATLMVLWNQHVAGLDFGLMLLYYGTLGALLVGAFGWIAGLSDWRLRVVISLLAVLLLSCF